MKTLMRIIIISILSFCLLILYVGCASIVHGTKQPVSINSTPTQADFEVKTEGGAIVFQGKTPATATLERKNSYSITSEIFVFFAKEF